MKTEERFKLALPKGVGILSLRLCLTTKGNDCEPLSLLIADDGAGPYVELKSETGVALNPDEFDELNKTVQAICKYIEKKGC